MQYQLSPEELAEFTLRLNTFQSARHHFLMVEESYQAWVRDVRARHQIPTARFSIDPQTGVITPSEE